MMEDVWICWPEAGQEFMYHRRTSIWWAQETYWLSLFGGESTTTTTTNQPRLLTWPTLHILIVSESSQRPLSTENDIGNQLNGIANFVPDDICFKVHFSKSVCCIPRDGQKSTDKTLGVTHFCLCVRQKKGGRRRTFSFFTSQSPSNSGGPISRQSCYYASFSPPHEDLESWWLTRRVGEKAFCSSRYVERDALLFHPHRKKKKKVFRCVCVCARGCWSLRGFFWLAATRQCIYIQLIPPLFSMTKYNIPKHAKVMKYIQTRLHHLLIEIHHF
jgi:hypothetical protein